MQSYFNKKVYLQYKKKKKINLKSHFINIYKINKNKI
jgi:hypothetical protein